MNAIQISNNAVASRINESQAAELFHKLVINSDLSTMSPEQQVEYYKLVCNRVGLDPYQKPFDLIKLSGKLTLYANKTCTAQLTSLRNLKVSIVHREVVGDQYVVTARCETNSGGFSEDIGAVPIGGLKGDMASNAMKKASTQAKRRAILAACGLGMLDEEEVLQIRDAVRVQMPDLDQKAEIVEMKQTLFSEAEEGVIVECIALIEGSTTAQEMNEIVKYMKTLEPAIRDSVKDKLGSRAKDLSLIWTKDGYVESKNAKR
jgi:hypothetical protein